MPKGQARVWRWSLDVPKSQKHLRRKLNRKFFRRTPPAFTTVVSFIDPKERRAPLAKLRTTLSLALKKWSTTECFFSQDEDRTVAWAAKSSACRRRVTFREKTFGHGRQAPFGKVYN